MLYFGAAFFALLAAGSADAQFTPAPASPFPVGSSPRAVAVADLNLDGKLDIVTANLNGNNVTVLLGNGSGGFAAALGSPFAVGTNPQAVAVADFNGDGVPDIVTANLNGTVTVLLGNGAGGFKAAQGSPFSVGTNPAIRGKSGTFNGDGKLDIVTANAGDNTITVLLGDGSGGFTAATGSPFAVGAQPVAVAVGDLNGDGKLDVVTANNGDNTITVLLGDGSGGFDMATATPFAVGANPAWLAVADLNGDGELDIVTANAGDNTVTELLGNGTGAFGTAADNPLAVGSKPCSVAVGDFNGDGQPDLMATANCKRQQR